MMLDARESNSSNFFDVAAVGDLTDPGKLTLEVDDRFVVLVHCDGKYYCIDDMCTHDGGPLGEGKLEGCQIACPRHGAKFDVTTGKALSFPATGATPTHQTKVENGRIFVQISAD